MAVSGISGSQDYYKPLSTGKQINSAADNAAGLAIAGKLQSQSNGYDVATRNAEQSNDMLSVAEGGLSSIQENLQRMRELAVQASNSAIYSNDDIAMMQDEINGLKGAIQDAAKGTEYNTLKLLDGSMADMNLAINPDGTGKQIQLENATLQALGIEDFDLTGSFDISRIDDALKMVSESRSNIGSTQNTLKHAINYNNLASENTTNSRSRITDQNMAKGISNLKKNETLNQYKMFALREKMKNQNLDVGRMLGN